MMTKLGEIADHELTVNVTEEKTVNAIIRTTQYFTADGELVRQDVDVSVLELPPLTAKLGEI